MPIFIKCIEALSNMLDSTDGDHPEERVDQGTNKVDESAVASGVGSSKAPVVDELATNESLLNKPATVNLSSDLVRNALPSLGIEDLETLCKQSSGAYPLG